MRLVKLSTAAAVAAGLATSASAVELTEAIKGVDVSGYVRYRMEMHGGEQDGESYDDAHNDHKYKYRFITTVPVNDQVNFVGTVGNVEYGYDQVNAVLTQGGEADLTDAGYGNSNIGLIHAYFQYTGVENLTVQAGKQPLNTPFDEDEHGNGLVGMYNAGPVTVAGAMFDSSNANNEWGTVDITANGGTASDGNINNGNNIMALAAIGSVEMVNFSAWYADHQDVFDAFTVDVNADIMDMVNVGIRHTGLSLEQNVATVVNGNNANSVGNSDGNSLTKIYADADIEMVNVRAAYAKTDDDGGLVAYDSDAATGFTLENLQIDTNGLAGQGADVDGYMIGAGTTFGKFSADIDYMALDYGARNGYTVEGNAMANGDSSELRPEVGYAMSDNLDISLFHSMIEHDAPGVAKVDDDETQLEVRYNF